ncbi:MAG: T9SS type A sorting domain-containing protein [Bacteroidales bacterium]
MKKIYKNLILCLVTILLFSNAIFAGSAPKINYDVNFVVKDIFENPISDAFLTIEGTDYPEGSYSFNLAEGNYSFSVTRFGYVTFTGNLELISDTVINVFLMPLVELSFNEDNMMIDFSWHDYIGTYDPGIIINEAPYNTDGAFVMLKLYDNNTNDILIFADVFEEFSIGGLNYHSGTSNRIMADFTGAQYNGNWGTKILSDNPTYGNSLRGTDLNGAIFYGIMISGGESVGIVSPTQEGNMQLPIGYVIKEGVYGDFRLEVDVYLPVRPGPVGSAGYHTYNELISLEKIAYFEYYKSVVYQPIEIVQQPQSIVICEGESGMLSIEATASDTLEYHWYYNGEPLNNDPDLNTIIVDEAGEYYCIVVMDTYSIQSEIATVSISTVEFTLPEDFTACAGTNVVIDAGLYASYLWNNNSTEQTITVTESGQYSVTVTNEYGCTASSQTLVTILELPTVDLGEDFSICQGSSAILEAQEAAEYLWSGGATTQSITVTEAGTYSVTITDENGCQNSAEVTVSVYSLPTVDLGDDITSCPGPEFEFTAPDASAYLWSNGETNQSITVSKAGTYSVTITDENGCQNSDSVQLILFPVPEVDLGDNMLVDEDQVFILGAPIGYTYLWSTGATTNYIVVNASDLQIGQNVISVTVTASNGCEVSDEVTITVIPGIYVEENLTDKVVLYPNPANDYLIIEGIEFNFAEIFDLTGRKLLVTKQNNINVSFLSSGQYFINLHTNDKIITYKFLKN